MVALSAGSHLPRKFAKPLLKVMQTSDDPGQHAPRDALVADIAPVRLRGASFGLRQSLDTVGAFPGVDIAVPNHDTKSRLAPVA